MSRDFHSSVGRRKFFRAVHLYDILGYWPVFALQHVMDPPRSSGTGSLSVQQDIKFCAMVNNAVIGKAQKRFVQRFKGVMTHRTASVEHKYPVSERKFGEKTKYHEDPFLTYKTSCFVSKHER